MPEKFETIKEAEDAAPTQEEGGQEKDVDENGLHRDLWQYRDEMSNWASGHKDDVAAFLAYRNVNFKLVFGTGFFHRPAQDIISLSVPWYKKAKESGEMTENQIWFAEFHEFAHLKTMWELDRAGKRNHLEQFNYEEQKRIRDKKDPAQFAALTPSYREFYNIFEDAIVNRMVLNSRLFSQADSGASRARAEEIKKLYTDQFFSIFRRVGEGRGEYIKNPDPNDNDNRYIFVGQGNGDLAILREADYEEGFDWSAEELEPPLNRSGQFLTFFIKREMGVISERDIYDSESAPNGKFNLHPDVQDALTKPLVQVYDKLLKKIVEKYQDDPAQMKRYIEFMSTVIKVPRYRVDNGKIIETSPNLSENVVSPNMVSGNKINIVAAKIFFKNRIKDACSILGIRNTEQASFFQIFDKYKTLGATKKAGLTIPFKHNLEERTRVTRHTLEKMFTMLCILDDNFDVELPPQSGVGGGGGKPQSPENPSKVEWQRGDRVKNIDQQSPHNGEKGVITNITYDKDGKILSVKVEYIKEAQSKMSAMAEVEAAEKGMSLTGESEDIFEPDKNLALSVKKGKKGGKGKGPKDPRKKVYEEDDENDDEDDDEDDEEDDNENDENDDEDDEEKEPKGEEDDGEKGEDLGDLINPLKDYLESLIEQDDKEADLEQLEKAKKTEEYKNKKDDLKKIKQLEQALAKKAKQARRGKELSPEDRQLVKEYVKLERELAPYAEKMAKAWLKVVDNIASTIIEVVKDRYYRSGNPDIKKVQEHFEKIEWGAEIDNLLIYERIIEIIKTELKPKMLRLSLLIDNSGSMEQSIDKIRVSIMLLNSSLRSFRVLFKDKMKKVLGSQYSKDIDIVFDTELRLFGERHTLVKDFDLNDLAFLKAEKASLPEIDVDRETLNTILAFKNIKANESATRDGEAWGAIYRAHNNEEIKNLLQQGMLTEAIMQISDGDIDNTAIAQMVIKRLKKQNIAVGGLAIGGSDALEALIKRHGEENTISADTPQELADKFGELLERIIVEQIQKPMEEHIKGLLPNPIKNLK